MQDAVSLIRLAFCAVFELIVCYALSRDHGICPSAAFVLNMTELQITQFSSDHGMDATVLYQILDRYL